MIRNLPPESPLQSRIHCSTRRQLQTIGANGRRIAESLAILLVIFTGCQNHNPDPSPSDFGYTYFPADSGLFREYLVKQVRYQIGEEVDSATWYMREVQGGSNRNENGDTVFIITRYIRNTPEESWAVDSLFEVKKNSRMVIRTESNIPYLKLVFPVREAKEWNGNSYNTLEKELYHYSKIAQPMEVMDMPYSNTVTVIQKELIDPIVNSVIKNEIYARNVGLIYRELTDYHYCTEEDCLGKQEILYGREYRQWIINYGHE